MYLKHSQGFGQAGVAPTLALDVSLVANPLKQVGSTVRTRVSKSLSRIDDIELVVDLGRRIGSREWWRGLATCTALCVAAGCFAPGFRPLEAPSGPVMGEAEWQEASASAISPLAYGGDTGRRMAPTEAVQRLADTPERPSIDLVATLGQGDGFARVLGRNGVGESEARKVAQLVSGAVELGAIKPGTRMELTLGRRPAKDAPRPLDHLSFRAKLELSLAVERAGPDLRLRRIPIAVDETPLRIQGRVGASLFQSARNAGAPAKAVETYLRALGQHVSVSRDVRSGDRFDLIIAHRRAATGETETGGLLYAGLDKSGKGAKNVRILKWESGGREQWFEASGVGQTKGTMRMPVAGRVTSSFGMRRHPLLGYSRLHKGIDYGAPYGAPIVAATDGVVKFSGWHGGHGKYVQLAHAGGLGTGYGHMSRIVATVGQRVAAGQVIGYVGSTGMSTGPHLHYELYRNGQAINPTSVKFASAPQLAGAELGRFRSTLNRLLATRLNNGAAPVQSAAKEEAKDEPKAKVADKGEPKGKSAKRG
ncbi:peptidoglycan DD-metalloendopeptidase family protein [Sphingomonas naphthae]|uniref:Peptidoglycan DD-metalloendopeptidase family protein n=1 Tax=Sphingomonas naphthae TaxID=1813468 RepID=A0ABY7TKJ8_9SPHN|nr:M23 family metallopeptidase [Sphingomonas naphthae]WCT73756.1 peptidoglycan DD-metalloendopeptidase family protein [Sphingomonas naphthae]